MEKCIYVVFILIVTGVVKVESNDDLACCAPPNNYFYVNDTIFCADREQNVTTVPYRLDCKYPRVPRTFNVTEDTIIVKWGEDDTEWTHTSKTACFGVQIGKDWKRTRPLVLVCRDEEDPSVKTLSYCQIVSVVFLGVTAIIYILLKQWDLFGKSVICFCASLAIGDSIYVIMMLMSYSNMTACAIRGFAAYFFLIATFFWSNSISIQVLIDTRPAPAPAWREFKWYALYSWGMPTLLTIIVAIVNYHPGDHMRPGIGLNACWFHHDQHLYYLYSVMFVLLLVNLLIFIYITTMVCRYRFNSSHINALKFRLSITVRLIVVMGLPWIFEMFNAIVNSNNIVMDIINIFSALQGIFVFLVLVVFRKQVIKSMRDRNWLVCCPGLANWLAAGDDVEENIFQRTELPMSEDQRTNGVVHS